MARLNEAPAPVESIDVGELSTRNWIEAITTTDDELGEIVKRRFLRQNRELAK
jgi:hypothetical protein